MTQRIGMFDLIYHFRLTPLVASMSDKPAEENINFTPRRAQSNFEPALNRAPSSKSLKKDAEEADQDTTEKKVMSEKRAIKYVQSKENLLKIFKREDELLRSPENQEAFTNATDTNAQVNLLLDIKLKAINEFNVEKPKRVVEVMVNAREIFRKDPDFVKQIKEHCMYLKYDRFNPDGKVLTGDLIPKCTFYELDGSFSTLSSIVQQKPLVLFAGSYSCATLRSHVIAQNALYKDFSKSVDFAMIYISEAHAKDEWPLGTKFNWDQPKTIEDRIAIAKKFQEETKYKIPLYVDTIEGSFEKAFECWPERWWLIYKNRVAMQGISQTGDAADYEQLVLWLKVYKTTL